MVSFSDNTFPLEQKQEDKGDDVLVLCGLLQ